MTWTYTLSNLATVGVSSTTADANKDAVRLEIGDTDTTDQLLQNEEILMYLLLDCGITTGVLNIYRGAAWCALAVAGHFARKVDKTIGPARLWTSQRQAQYRELHKDLLMRARMFEGVPYAGGISIADKLAEAVDADRVPPFFHRDMETIPSGVRPLSDPTSLIYGTGG